MIRFKPDIVKYTYAICMPRW